MQQTVTVGERVDPPCEYLKSVVDGEMQRRLERAQLIWNQLLVARHRATSEDGQELFDLQRNFIKNLLDLLGNLQQYGGLLCRATQYAD